jgi:hypothetical protein
MRDEYVDLCDVMCDEICVGLGVTVNDAQLRQLQDALSSQPAEAYAASPSPEIVISYQSPVGTVVNYGARTLV